MKAKRFQGLAKNDGYKEVIIKELEFVLQKMNESPTVLMIKSIILVQYKECCIG